MKTGFKATNEDLKCRGHQFEIGSIYHIDSNKNLKKLDLDLEEKLYEKYEPVENKNLRECTNDVIHYCNKIHHVFDYYRLNDKNRFFEVQIIGDYIDKYRKSGTTAIRFLREISKEYLEKIQSDSYFNLELVKELQLKNPNMILGGSVALYILGVRLDRWSGSSKSDLDIILPYYISPLEFNSDTISVEENGYKASSNDFDETFICYYNNENKEKDANDIWSRTSSTNGIKIDFKVNPKQKYKIVEYDGFKYKVSPLEDILEAKLRYAFCSNGEKHLKDIYEMCTSDRKEITKYIENK